MKKFQPSAAAAVAIALAGSSVLLVAGPASAATTVEHVTFYGASDFGVEDGGYPAGDWFYGDVALDDGVTEFTPSGLEVNTSGTPGQVQILNQNVGVQPATAAEMEGIIDDVEVYSADEDWTFQIPFFAEAGETGFTTLRPVDEGTAAVGGTWVTSQAIAATATTPAYAAGDTATLVDLLDALYGDDAPTLLAYGFFFDADDTDALQAIWWRGEASAFTPVYTRSASPNPITTTQFTTTGLEISMTGVLPGSSAYIELYDPNDVQVYYSTALNADENGVFTSSIVLSDVEVGTYNLILDDGLGEDSYAYGFLSLFDDDDGVPIEIEVTAPAPTLPATGPAQTAGMLGVALFVLVGGAGLVVASRRGLRTQ